MIVYKLACRCGHTFDQWFDNMAAYEDTRASLECPACGGRDVSKAIMAPRVAKAAAPPMAPCGRAECPSGGCAAF